MLAISRDEWLTGKSKICEDMKMVYRTLSVDEAEQFWSLMNQLDYYMARKEHMKMIVSDKELCKSNEADSSS